MRFYAIIARYLCRLHMSTSTIFYHGDLRTEMTHTGSGKAITTDAPVDNHGLGQAFSPTDLVATALGSCMITLMGIAAQAHRITGLEGTTAEIQKKMRTDPRRISGVDVTIHFSRSYESRERQLLEYAAITCPVAKSLHPDIQQNITFIYPD